MLPLDQQTVFLTGAAQGLGAAIARHFSARGARLVLFDWNSEGLERTVAECSGTPRAIVVDLTSAADTARALSDATADVAAVDTLIHNAAILKPEPFSEITLETFRAHGRCRAARRLSAGQGGMAGHGPARRRCASVRLVPLRNRRRRRGNRLLHRKARH